MFLLVALQAAEVGCSERRRFDSAKLDWLGLFKKSGDTAVASSGQGSKGASRGASQTFRVWVLSSKGTDECLDQVWSYIDELLPGKSREWEVVNRNGLRCGIGNVHDWSQVKEQLEKCRTDISLGKASMDVSVTRTTRVVLLTDEFRERILFCHTRSGQLRGGDSNSKLQLTLIIGGRSGDGRQRVVLSPRIIKRVRQFKPIRSTGSSARRAKTVERELEDLSIVIDLADDEFLMVGPSATNQAKSLIGSQLFTKWQQGQRSSYFILVVPLAQGRAAVTGDGKN